MHLALWDIPPVDVLISGMGTGTASVPLELERHDARTCVELLRRGMVDAAFLPSMVVLSATDAFDVLPGAALSTWKYPYARLALHRGLEAIESVAFSPYHAQEALVARIILREHYGKDPVFVSYEGASVTDLLGAGQDASLVVGADVPTLQTEHLALDLGEEWFELSNYPMVWGLFVALKDEATPAMVEAILRAVRAAEQHRAVWMQAREMPPSHHAFFTRDLRLRLDDLAVASLTEFRHYLYYYNVTEELPIFPLYELPEDWEDDEDEVPLL